MGSSAHPGQLTLPQKSALLNLGLLTTALPLLAITGEPRAFVPIFILLTVISLLIWIMTLVVNWTLVMLSVLSRLHSGTGKPPREQWDSRPRGGLADSWLDGPA